MNCLVAGLDWVSRKFGQARECFAALFWAVLCYADNFVEHNLLHINVI